MKHALIGLALLTVATTGLAQQRSALAQQVFAAESSFAAAMANRDTAAFASWIARDAIFFGGPPPGVSRGKNAVLAAWAGFFMGPTAPFSWCPAVVEVLENGTLAHSSGPVFDRSGKQTSTFNSVWRRDADGRWRVVFDKGCACP